MLENTIPGGIITRAFEHVRAGGGIHLPMISNRLKSQRWVESLAAEFRLFYGDEGRQAGVRVLCRSDSTHKDELGLDGLLYDVLVCRVSTVRAPRGRELTYVCEALWQVESELARDTRQALKDFSKLVLGAAPSKLFVGPYVGQREQKGYLDALAAPARVCTGIVYLAQIPHPAAWDSDGPGPKVMVFQADQWQEIGGV